MLNSLHIKNIVLVDQLTLDFGHGLTALTGETGAGKSILLDSLGLALGARADSQLLRHGTDGASVTASIDIPADHAATEVLAGQGLVVDKDLILRRTLTSDGRSRAFINDEPVSAGLLKELGEHLVDIHGQFETYGLLNPVMHRQVLDTYAGVGDLVKAVEAAYRTWKDKERAIDEALEQAARAMENEDWLRGCVEELEKLAPQPGEEAELVALRQKQQNRESVLELLGNVTELLGGEQGADMQIGQAWRLLHKGEDKMGPAIPGILETLDQAARDVQEAVRQVESLLGDVDEAGQTLEQIEDRLYALRGAARKHQCLVEDLPAKREELSQKLRLMDHQDHVLATLEKEAKAAKADYKKTADSLHQKRVEAARRLDGLVKVELAPLKLDKAAFLTSVDEQTQESAWTSTGVDAVQFLVSTNAGTPPGPLHKIASGGEMARFMLALKVVLAEASSVPAVYVFDEIDTGIGGATASAVGERLARLAERHQVMVVTHSPQVAARARHHWLVSKSSGKTAVTPLSTAERREEIARMLSGSTITEEARAAASKLLEAS